MANSATVKNRGEKVCEVIAPGLAGPKGMTRQVAKVHKTLLSLGRLAKAGWSSMFSDVKGNFIENNSTG